MAKNGEMTPWENINKELDRRHKTWAWLAQELGTTDQVVHNWKKRGVPSSRFRAIAEALTTFTVDQIEGVGQAPTNINGGRSNRGLLTDLRAFALAITAADQDTRDDVLAMLTLFLKNPKANAGAIALIGSRLSGGIPPESEENQQHRA